MRPFATDAVLVEGGKILLIKRSKEPGAGLWAIPGGRIEDNETAEECMLREMKEETGLDIQIERMVSLYSEPDRDPRKIIAASYLVRRTGGRLKAGDDAGDARWFDLELLPDLAFDHKRIISDALECMNS